MMKVGEKGFNMFCIPMKGMSGICDYKMLQGYKDHLIWRGNKLPWEQGNQGWVPASSSIKRLQLPS